MNQRWPALLCAAALVPGVAEAQYTDVPEPAAYALQAVTLVDADGRRSEGVTVVVRGDFIEALGPGIPVPPDARVLDGDSLMVYPGLIDGWGEVAVEFPEPEIDRSTVEIWNAPRALQGFMPARRVVDHLTATGEEVADQRARGVVAAAVHPGGAMMPGRGALLLFRAAADPRGLVLVPELGPTLTWQGGRGVYPATLFGVTAFMRQALEDARRRQVVLAAYREDPRGLEPPTHDPDYDVLAEVLSGTSPFFHASSSEDILRVLRLADAYAFRPIILGGGEAWKVADRLRERDVPVLVDLDFPEPTRWSGPESAEREEPESGTEAPAQDQAEPLAAATLREKARLEDLYANAGRLADAGVTVILTSGGGAVDLREGAARAVGYGLSEAAALQALTANPAALYGVPRLARIEAGLPATFLVTDGPLFSRDTRVVYTFVEGQLEEGGGPSAGDEPPAVDVTGTWELEIDSEAGTIRGTMTLTQDGARFRGSVQTEFGPARIRDGVVSGTEITFVVDADDEMTLDFTGTVDGDDARGTGSGPIGRLRWTATRSPGARGR